MIRLATICLFIIIGVICCAQNKNAHNIIVDKDKNKYPVKLLKDGNWWMTANMNTDIPGSFGYSDTINSKGYGRLYNWEAANKACSLLKGDWQLPDKDQVMQLVALYGGVPEDSLVNKKAAYKALMHAGSSGFDAVLGGNLDAGGKYARIEAHGFYWTITEDVNNTAWYANFAKGSQALFMQDGGEKERYFSVRCIKKH